MLSSSHDFTNMGPTAFMNGFSSSISLDDDLQGSEDALNEELAEAILRRPDSLRTPSASFGPSSRSASVVGRATKDGFTFASLSELGNPQSYRASHAYDDDEGCKGSSRNPGEKSSASDSSQQPPENVHVIGPNEELVNDASSTTPRAIDGISDK